MFQGRGASRAQLEVSLKKSVQNNCVLLQVLTSGYVIRTRLEDQPSKNEDIFEVEPQSHSKNCGFENMDSRIW